MENKSITYLMAAFIALIIGVSLVGVIASEGLGKTSYTEVNSETHSISTHWTGTNYSGGTVTVTNAPTSWKAGGECPISSVLFGNSSVDYTVTTDYTVNANTGVITITAASAPSKGGNTTYVDYKYCADDYLKQSWNRTIINLVPGFFAIGLLLIAVGLFYRVAKDEGLI